ncbi:MAG: DinB family protein [Gemmatimonadales bacterium]
MTDRHDLIAATCAVLLRDLAAVKREVEAYPDDASLWVMRDGLPNSGGTLALHLAGNLQHFVGAVLGKSGYVRDREAEFAERGVSRAEVVRRLAAAEGAVAKALDGRTPLPEIYPAPAGGMQVRTDEWLLHSVAHLGYHLGQIDYHRRIVTGNASGIGALAITELPSAHKP